jgi:hypothetical protein
VSPQPEELPALIVVDTGYATDVRKVPWFEAHVVVSYIGQLAVPPGVENDAPTQSKTVTFDSGRLPVSLFVTVPLTPTSTATRPLSATRKAPPGTPVAGLEQLFVMVMPVEKDRARQFAVLEVALADPPPVPPIVAVT